MRDSFSAHAIQGAGHAALLLGWRPDEFWNATPQELGSVLNLLHVDETGQEPMQDTLTALMEKFPDG